MDALLAAAAAKPGVRKFLIRDIRLFLNALNHHLDTMRAAGIDAKLGRTESDEQIVLTVTLPKRAGTAAEAPETDKRACTSEASVV